MGTGTEGEGEREQRRDRERELREKGGGGELRYPPHQEISRVQDQALPFRARHYLCRQSTPTGSQQLLAQDSAPDLQCGTEGKTVHQREEREETVTGTGAGTGTRTGMSTRAGMGARTGAGTGTRIEMRVERRDSLGTFEVVMEVLIVEVGRKTREGGRRQLLTSNHSRKTRRTSETVASYEGPDLRYGRRGTGSGRVEKRRRSARNPRRVVDVMWKTGETNNIGGAEGGKNVYKKALVQ